MAEIHLRARHTKCAQTQDQECQTKEEVTYITVLLQVDQHNTKEESRINHIRDIERHTCRHNPSCERGSNIGTHNNRDGLSQRKQTGIYKRNGHYRGCCR